MAQRVAVRAQLRFQVRPCHAGLEHGQLRLAVERHERAHAAHVDAQRGPRADGVEVPGHAGAAAVRHDGRVDVRRPAQQRAHVFAALGIRDAVRRRADAAVAQAQPVLQALAGGMREPRGRTPVDERMRRQPAGRQRGAQRVERGIARRRARADARAQKRQRGCAQRYVDRLVSPAVPASHPAVLLMCIAAIVMRRQSCAVLSLGPL